MGGAAALSAQTAESAADLLWAAVERKRLAADPRVDLAIDVFRVPVLALPAVVAEFHAKYGKKAAAVGFRAVWVVPPMDSLAARLDTP